MSPLGAGTSDTGVVCGCGCLLCPKVEEDGVCEGVVDEGEDPPRWCEGPTGERRESPVPYRDPLPGTRRTSRPVGQRLVEETTRGGVCRKRITRVYM